MTTIAQVREQMATICQGVSGINGSSAYLADAVANTPGVHISRQAFDPRLVMSKARAGYPFQLVVYGSRLLDKQSQQLLESFCEPSGTTSITAAIEDGTKWGTVDVNYASVTNIGAIQESAVAGVTYFVVVFDVEVVW